MTTYIHPKIQRKSEVIKQLSISKSTLHNWINEGLHPPAVPLGARAVGWLQHETDAIIAALAAEKSGDELKALVRSLVEQRKELGGWSYGH